jgi:hypothetical protein
MLAVRILAVIGGSLAVAWVLWSAIRTVIVPRGESVWLSRKVFIVVRELFEFAGRRTRSYEGYDRIMARYAPMALILLPAAWALVVLIAFVPMYWAFGVSPWQAIIWRLVVHDARLSAGGLAPTSSARAGDHPGSSSWPVISYPSDLRRSRAGAW